MHAGQRQGLVTLGGVIEIFQQLRRGAAFLRCACHAKNMTAIGDLDAHVFFDLLEVLVVTAAQAGEPAIVRGGEAEFDVTGLRFSNARCHPGMIQRIIKTQNR